jgi:hypothetical protein
MCVLDAMKTMSHMLYGYGWQGVIPVHSKHVHVCWMFEDLQQLSRQAGVTAHEDYIFGGAP